MGVAVAGAEGATGGGVGVGGVGEKMVTVPPQHTPEARDGRSETEMEETGSV